MAKYRKRPVVIEAYQWFSHLNEMPGVRYIAAHAVDYTKKDVGAKSRGIIHEAPARWVIETLEGVMEVSEGDWVIRGIKGEFYPCKPDIFLATYEPVEEQNNEC